MGTMWSNSAFPSPVRWDTRADDPEVKRLDLNNAPSLAVDAPAIPLLQAALQAFLTALCPKGPSDTIHTVVDILGRIHPNSPSLGVEVGTALSVLPISREQHHTVGATIAGMIQAKQ